MNVHGLVALALYFPGYTYNVPSQLKINVKHTHVISFFLEKTRNVQDVFDVLSEVNIIDSDDSFPSVQWFFADSSGATLVLEPGHERLNWHRNINVCTNSPSSALSVEPKAQDLPGDFSSASRLARLRFFATHVTRIPDKKKAANTMFRILNNFDIPPGVSDESTLYTSVYNLTDNIMSHRTDVQAMIRGIQPSKSSTRPSRNTIPADGP
jgi:choloylglycine hydrolase